VKQLILPFFVTCAALATLAADTPSLTGKWQVHTSIAGNDNDQNCTFTQKDAALTGTCTSDRGTVTITGAIDAKKVKWTYKSEYEGSPLTVNYDGVIESESKITGSVSVPEFSVDGDFTATLAK
jgi:hypothetical protein